MYLIALTGGIASGKSLVASRLAELGAVHVDADLLAREVVEPGTPGLSAITEAFGPSVITPDGSLDRAALGAIVFADPEQRAVLNAITHPAVWARAQDLFIAAVDRDPAAVIVYDVPLFVEAAVSRQVSFDLVVVVDTKAETRIRRLVELRGMTPQEAARRLDAQAGDSERLAMADLVIDNDGAREATIEQVDRLWAALRERGAVASTDGSALG